jgi:4-amino-4-deoxy-L-arabinose transferase-like glycosyltransferase
MLTLTALAFALRLPYYDLVPALTDETRDLYRSLLTARGEFVGLTGTSSYIGALWEWLAAGAFLVSGHQLYAPRLLMVVLGSLTVPATYLLGRAWGGRVGGLIAGGLLGTSLVHVVVNSHVAWSNCATPLFSTLAAWATWRAGTAGRRDGGTARQRGKAHPSAPLSRRPLLAAGLLWGLAVQTHPTALAFAGGAGAYLAWRAPGLLRTRWAALAGGLFLLANLNLLAYNLATGFDSVVAGQGKSEVYARGEDLTPAVYLERLGLLALGLLQNLGNVTGQADGDASFLAEPAVWPIFVLAGLGLVRQWRRGNALPLLILASAAAIMPLVNGKYNLLLNGRYLAPLLPIVFACVGSLLAGELERLGRPDRDRTLDSAVGRPALVALAAFLVLQPLLPLREYYERQAPISARVHRPIFETVARLEASRRPGERILVDETLHLARLDTGDGRFEWAVLLQLGLHGVPARLANVDSGELLDPRTRCADQLVLLAVRPAEVHEPLVERLGLVDLGDEMVRHRMNVGGVRIADGHAIYRLPRRPDAAAC